MTNELIVGILLAVVGSTVALFFWFVQRYFSRLESVGTANCKQINELSSSVSKLLALDAHLTDTVKALCKRSESVIESLHAIKSDLKDLSKDTGRLEGRFDEHIAMNAQYIQSIGHMSRQVDALFRFVDAPKRATDKG